MAISILSAIDAGLICTDVLMLLLAPKLSPTLIARLVTRLSDKYKVTTGAAPLKLTLRANNFVCEKAEKLKATTKKRNKINCFIEKCFEQ